MHGYASEEFRGNFPTYKIILMVIFAQRVCTVRPGSHMTQCRHFGGGISPRLSGLHCSVSIRFMFTE